MKQITTVFLAALFALCIGLSGQVMAAEAVKAPAVQKADVETKAADTVKDETLKAGSEAEKTKHEMHEMKEKQKHEMTDKAKHEMKDKAKHEMKGKHEMQDMKDKSKHEMKEKTKHEMHEMNNK